MSRCTNCEGLKVPPGLSEYLTGTVLPLFKHGHVAVELVRLSARDVEFLQEVLPLISVRGLEVVLTEDQGDDLLAADFIQRAKASGVVRLLGASSNSLQALAQNMPMRTQMTNVLASQSSWDAFLSAVHIQDSLVFNKCNLFVCSAFVLRHALVQPALWGVSILQDLEHVTDAHAQAFANAVRVSQSLRSLRLVGLHMSQEQRAYIIKSVREGALLLSDFQIDADTSGALRVVQLRRETGELVETLEGLSLT